MMPFRVTETSKAGADPTKHAVHLSGPTSPGPSTGASCSAPRTAAWFLFDIVFYGNTLFKGAILAVLSKEQSLNDNLVHSTILFVRQLRK